MAEKNIRWTKQQYRAIKQRNSDVLVTASAGTGKTAVLSGRCVDIVSDSSLCPDILSVLVLTFTDAAAEQMRSRIAEQLRAEFKKSHQQHLRRQLMLLQGADISTIHSFCKRLITEHFYKVPVFHKYGKTEPGRIGIDPTFRVIDSDEQKLLKAEVLEKTIDWAWQQSNLAQGLTELLDRRDLRTNDGFLENIIETSNFLDGIITPEKWYVRALFIAGASDPFTTQLGERQKQIVTEKLNRILNKLEHARKLYIDNCTDDDWADKLQVSHIEPVKKCIEFIKDANWEQCIEAVRDFSKPTTYTPKNLAEPISSLLYDTAKTAIDSFSQLSKFALVNPDYLNKVSRAASRQTSVLVELVKKFDQLYSQAKQNINCLDFADLEHYALRLLTDGDYSDDNISPSPTALELRKRYKYIFVDEYQDINPVQQAILDLLSSGDNVFVVGDVKQSIYAWRGATSDVFLERLRYASIDPVKAQRGLRVDLNTNWRSAKGILDFVNSVFSRIMTADFVNIDYDESAHLKPAPEDKPAKQAEDTNMPVVEIHLLDKKNKADESSQGRDLSIFNTNQYEAAVLAQRIRQMVGAESGKPQFQIYDKQQDKYRAVDYRDIVILMRSPAKKANRYAEMLRLASVPVSCQDSTGYFETTEITDIINLLKVLDNPQRDIELAAVLRSPFFNVSDTELAQIKLHCKNKHCRRDFYHSLLLYCKSGPNTTLTKKIRRIFDVIEDWQALARRGSIADLIWKIYRYSDFLSFVLALPNGRNRRANLLKLHDRAIQFEGFASSAGMASLVRFVGFIEKLLETGRDWAPAEPEEAAENAVRIMSIHKSKGLEFPVVFLADLDSRFNKKDIYGELLADAECTLGLQVIDQQSNSKLSSLAHQVIAEQKLLTTLAEEMRILYVATTRARERLILTASKSRKKCRDIICNGLFSGKTIADWQLMQCYSLMEWILYALSNQRNLHEAFETELSAQTQSDSLFSVNFYSQDELNKLYDYITELKDKSSVQSIQPIGKAQLEPEQSKLLGQIKKSLSWHYHYGQVWKLPAKQSVTEITHHNDEYAEFNYMSILARKPRIDFSAELDLSRPVDSRLLGIATHLVISELDLTKPVSKDTIEKTKEKLVIEGLIAESVAGLINTESIIGFFESDLGLKILDAYPDVWREWSFTFALPTSQWQPHSTEKTETKIYVGGDNIIVQGIIDMLARTPGGLLIIDFKTDNITVDQVTERTKLYKRQLELYGMAATAILKTELAGKWLYFLTPNCSTEV